MLWRTRHPEQFPLAHMVGRGEALRFRAQDKTPGHSKTPNYTGSLLHCEPWHPSQAGLMHDLDVAGLGWTNFTQAAVAGLLPLPLLAWRPRAACRRHSTPVPPPPP